MFELLGRGETDPLVSHVVDWVELSEEDISQNPGKSTGKVHAHDSTDALSHSKLSHLKKSVRSWNHNKQKIPDKKANSQTDYIKWIQWAVLNGITVNGINQLTG